MRCIRFARSFLWSSGFLLILTSVTAPLFAQDNRFFDTSQLSVPEIDGATAGAAIACLLGGYLVLRSRFQK